MSTGRAGVGDGPVRGLQQFLSVQNLPEDPEAAVPLPLVVFHPRHDGGRLRYFNQGIVGPASNTMVSRSDQSCLGLQLDRTGRGKCNELIE